MTSKFVLDNILELWYIIYADSPPLIFLINESEVFFMGMYLEGLYIGSEPRKDGSGFNILVSIGMDAYRVRVPEILDDLKIGCKVKMMVRPNVYNNRLYLYGYII